MLVGETCEVFYSAAHPCGDAGASSSSSSSASGVENGALTDDSSARLAKDPRKIARRYQLELCKKAMEENIIVYLGTGCGKTHIAVMVIYELAHLILKPKKSVCIFLAPTVALVQQQASVIAESINFKVATHCGGNRTVKSHSDWEREISENEVLVMTPQILLHNLQHCFIKMECISLLILDECHHAQVQSNHPYAQIMKVFYETEGSQRPQIFGMTASPVVGKGSFQAENLSKSINSLENLLNAKVYSVENKSLLDGFVSSPIVKVYYYGSAMSDSSRSTIVYENMLEEIKQQCLTSLKQQIDSHQSQQSRLNMKRLLKRTHENLIYSLLNLGLWGALMAARILLNSDHEVREELVEGNHEANNHSLSDAYLSLAANVLSADIAKDENASELLSLSALKEPLFSKKLLQLIKILLAFRLEPHMKCIIFVNRIVTARSLSSILNNLKLLCSWKSDFLVGLSSGLKTMSRKSMYAILERFRSKELNLLVATKVGEEGLDIQTCCLVIRFDLPETVTSFIQSRGRARMPQSEYAFLVDRGNQKEMDLIENFKVNEGRMNLEITSRTSEETCLRLDDDVYRVDETGACISGGSSISLIYRYCSRLPHDEFFQPKPEFVFNPVDTSGGVVCRMILPANAPISEIISSVLPSVEAAKKDVCLKAVNELHKLGVLNDFLLPDSKDDFEDEWIDDDSSFVTPEGEVCSRGELYEMLVPGVFKEKWEPSMGCVNLHSYYIKFVPDPADRVYQKFALFMKSPLPIEAETIDFELHLAHHRSVAVTVFAGGVTEFNNDEIKLAEGFQEVALKVLFERQELIPDFVPLVMQNTCRTNISTFYLLLPISKHDADSIITIDWVTIRSCLSSPIFKAPSGLAENISPTGSHLKLANGYWATDDVKHSLVFTTHKKQFYFVVDICHEKNGFSPVKVSSSKSHVDMIYKSYGLELKHALQPLLIVKPLSHVRNLLHNRKGKNLEPHELEEYFIEVPPELCQLKIIRFSKEIGSSLTLLPSIMHRVENLLVATELKYMLSASIPETAEVTVHRVLEALTTEKCQERFSLERLEVLGDAFLKFAVSRHLFLHHDRLDEGELTRRRSDVVNNSNLFRLAIRKNLQVYIRDQEFDPAQFFTFGHPCRVTCDKGNEVHISDKGSELLKSNGSEIRCSKGHHWLQKKTIADVVEALVGAFLIDTGFKGAMEFLRWFGIYVDFDCLQVRDACVASKRYMSLTSHLNLTALEDLLGYKFLHKGLLLQACIHPSYNKHGGGCYQRLEFLGDAVLDYLMTSYFFTVFPNLKPGQLTDLRALSVNNKALANVAVSFSLERFLFCDSIYLREAINDYRNSLATPPLAGGLAEGPKCPKVLGDLIESCLGALFLDCGFNLNHVWRMMLSFLDPIKNLSNLQVSPVKELLELCQSYKWDREMSVTKKDGAFSVELKVTKEGSCLTASAVGRNKRESAKKAAQLMIKNFKAHEHITASYPLEDVLRNSFRNEAKLIGYNEEPIDVNCDGLDFENLNLQESFDENPVSESEGSETSSSCCIRRVLTQQSSEEDDRLPQNNVREAGGLQPRKDEASSQPTGVAGPSNAGPSGQDPGEDAGPSSIRRRVDSGQCRKTAKSLLHETCVANCWKPPNFQCCDEEGPGHLKSFIYKVILEIEDAPNMTLECYGDARPTKKCAAERAAEAALWCLEHTGFLH